MKKWLSIVLALSLCLSLCACSIDLSGTENDSPTVQQAEFGDVVMMGDMELVMSGDILTATQVNSDTSCHNAFMTTDLSVGNSVDIASDGYILVVISYTIKNVGKEKTVFAELAGLNYNDGYIYDAKEQYFSMSDPTYSWTLFTSSGVYVNPLTTLECKAYLSVPEEVFSNTEAPLKLTIGNYEFTVR